MSRSDFARAAPPAAAAEVLDFWFGAVDQARAAWFRKSDAFDREIEARFGRLVDAAVACDEALADWQRSLAGSLALVLVMDQFTRNIHRGTPRAFAGDARALALARRLVAADHDRALAPLRRSFVYLPFEHSEDLAAQEESVRLYAALAEEAGDASPHRDALAGALDYARRHRDIVARFGRFPHRNAILGRESSEEESAFLRLPGSGF